LAAVLAASLWLSVVAPLDVQAASTAAGPSVKITSPADGAVIDSTDVTVTIDVGDIKLVPGTQATQKSDMHVHYLLDVDPTPWLDGKHDIPTGDPNIVHSASTSHTFTYLAPGPHRVTVILTTSDHIAVQPPVAPSVNFTVKLAVAITSPAAGAMVIGPDVTVTIDVGDIKLVPGAQATQKSDMHVHYLLDVDPTPWLDGKHDIPTGDPNIVHSAATSHTFTNLAPGPHRVTVILSSADHLAVQPPVAPSVSFTVVDQSVAQLPKAGGAPESALLAVGLLGLALTCGGLALRRHGAGPGVTKGPRP
jgi:LPXTG-motif cell wall-anchored protein